MAKETQKPAAELAAAGEVVAPVEKEKSEAKEPALEAVEGAATGSPAEEAGIPQSESFKEESNIVADLEDPEKKALDELKKLLEAALIKNEFTKPPSPPPEPPKEEDKPSEEASEPLPAAVEPAVTEEPAVEKQEEPPTDPVATESSTSVAEETKVVVIEETAVADTAPAAEEPAPAGAEEETEPAEEVFLWGVPLVGEEKSDTILLKFLRARDFKVKEAMAMLKNAVIWRKEFGIDGLVEEEEEDLGLPELEKVVFMNGHDKEGHPVCYNVYGEFQDKELFQKVLSDEEKRQKFLKWRIRFLEKGIRQHLDFTPGGISTMVQVTDLKNSPGPGKKELRLATNQALAVLQDNYPEFVAKQIFINVPWWYLAFNRMISPFLTQRTKSKFVFAGPSKSSDTLFKYIAPEQVPVQYGGLSKDSDPDFSTSDAVSEITIKPTTKQSIEIPVPETCVLVWELRVLGWDVSYGSEFVPSSEDGYTVIVEKTRKLVASDEPVLKNSFKIGEPGKIILTVDNSTSKKKKLLYRSKTKTSTDST